MANHQKFGRIIQKEADEKLAQPDKYNKYIETAEKKSNFPGICLECLNTIGKNSDSRSWLDKCCLYCYLIGWIYAVPETAGEDDKGFVDQVDDPVLDWDIGLQIKIFFS